LSEKEYLNQVAGVKIKGAFSALVHRDQHSARGNSAEELYSEGESSKEQQVCDYPVFHTTAGAAQIGSERSFNIDGLSDWGSQGAVTLIRKEDTQPVYKTARDIGRPVKAQEQRAVHGERGGTDVTLITNIDLEPEAGVIKEERQLHGMGIRSHQSLSPEDDE
jgi:hypothetical protein